MYLHLIRLIIVRMPKRRVVLLYKLIFDRYFLLKWSIQTEEREQFTVNGFQTSYGRQTLHMRSMVISSDMSQEREEVTTPPYCFDYLFHLK